MILRIRLDVFGLKWAFAPILNAYTTRRMSALMMRQQSLTVRLISTAKQGEFMQGALRLKRITENRNEEKIKWTLIHSTVL